MTISEFEFRKESRQEVKRRGIGAEILNRIVQDPTATETKATSETETYLLQAEK